MTEERIDEGIERNATSDAFTDAEKIALAYAERMGTAPETIDEAFYQDLARHYSVEEIVELDLNDEEQSDMQASGAHVREVIGAYENLKATA